MELKQARAAEEEEEESKADRPSLPFHPQEKIIMKIERFRKTKNHVIDDGDVSSYRVRQDFKLGDITWIRDEDSNWWPAQIVDGKTIARDNKPKGKVACETLVRLYGTYDYLYIDLIKCRFEFEKAFKQSNVSVREKFQEALEVISRSCNHKSKMNSIISGSKEAPMETGSKNKETKKNMNERNKEAELLASKLVRKTKTDRKPMNDTPKEKRIRKSKVNENVRSESVKFKKPDEAGVIKSNNQNMRKTRAAKKTTAETSKQDCLRKRKVEEAIGVEFPRNTKQQNMDGSQKSKQRSVPTKKPGGVSEQSIGIQNALDNCKSPRLDSSKTKVTEKQREACKQWNDRKAVKQKCEVNCPLTTDLDDIGARRLKEQDFNARRESPRSAKPPASARRIRMMQRLGLIAPAGSPFLKNGFTRATLKLKL